MSNNIQKEDQRKKFEDWYWKDTKMPETVKAKFSNWTNEIFEYFYRLIEQEREVFARAERIENSTFEERCSEASHYTWLDDKLQSQENLLKAAEEVIYLMKVPTEEKESEEFYEVLEKYNTLKSTLNP